MEIFSKVGDRLEKWAIQVKNARAETIADITKEAIRDLADKQYFDLPDEFIEYINEYEKKEGALQAIADYRDHFIHPFHVFCLGYLILKRWIEGVEGNEIEKIPLYLTENQDPDYNLKVWFIASVYHDVGFPAEKLEVLIQDIFKTTSAGRELKSQFDWSPLILAYSNIDNIHRVSKLYNRKSGNQDVNDTNFEKWFYKRLLEDHDHGALTALMLFNQGWRKVDKDKKYGMVEEAALAIALHSYRYNSKKRKSVSFDIGQLPVEDFPLAFFLSYCDLAQEWGRKVLLELIKKSYRSGVTSSTQHLTGLNSKLVPPVPELTTEKVKDGERIKTTVVIRYPVEAGSKVSGGETLEKIFSKFADRFKSTWYLKNQDEKDFLIQGNDVNGHSIGDIHPLPRPGT